MLSIPKFFEARRFPGVGVYTVQTDWDMWSSVERTEKSEAWMVRVECIEKCLWLTSLESLAECMQLH